MGSPPSRVLVSTAPAKSHPFDFYTGGMPERPLRLSPTQVAAKKAGLELSNIRGERLATVLYQVLPAGEQKPSYLLSSTYHLTVAEQRWISEHGATVTKLGRFPIGGTFMPLQMNMVRKKKSAAE